MKGKKNSIHICSLIFGLAFVFIGHPSHISKLKRKNVSPIDRGPTIFRGPILNDKNIVTGLKEFDLTWQIKNDKER